MGDIILCNISDANSSIEEARLYWTYEVLTALGVPDEILFETKDIRDFRYKMEGLGIEVVLKNNEEVDIFKKQWREGVSEEYSGWLEPTEEHLVAQWKKPDRVRKVEGKDVYYEIHLNKWSMFNTRK